MHVSWSQVSIKNNLLIKSLFSSPFFRDFDSHKFLFRQNSLPYARFMVAVSKRNFKKAITRNKFKRIQREIFRIYREELVGIDVVVVVKKNTDFASSELVWREFCRSL